MVIFAAVGCGAAAESSQADEDVVGSTEVASSQPEGVAAAAATSTTTLTTSSVASVDEEPEFTPYAQRALTPGKYQTSQSDPAIQLEVVQREAGFEWRGRFENEWGVVMVIDSEDVRDHPSKEPGLNIALAESGSTVASVTDRVANAQPETRFAVSVTEGELAGQPASIIVHESLREGTNWSILQMKTGESSYFDVLYEEGRVIETYVMTEGDRVLVYSFSAHRDLLDYVRTEALLIVDSVEFESQP